MKKIKSQKKKIVQKPKMKLKVKKKSNVIAFPSQPKKQITAKKVETPKAKVHPFAQFMKSKFGDKKFSKQTQKLGSHDVYRKKAI